jgi:organic radical activating enzyme
LLKENREACVDFILANPAWRLSTQTHKILGID